MELSQAHLRYLLAIGELSQGKAAVSSTQVARVLQVSRPSVTRMLAVLAEKDLVTKERYGKITLTETGAALAHQLQAGLRDLERRAGWYVERLHRRRRAGSRGTETGIEREDKGSETKGPGGPMAPGLLKIYHISFIVLCS